MNLCSQPFKINSCLFWCEVKERLFSFGFSDAIISFSFTAGRLSGPQFTKRVFLLYFLPSFLPLASPQSQVGCWSDSVWLKVTVCRSVSLTNIWTVWQMWFRYQRDIEKWLPSKCERAGVCPLQIVFSIHTQMLQTHMVNRLFLTENQLFEYFSRLLFVSSSSKVWLLYFILVTLHGLGMLMSFQIFYPDKLFQPVSWYLMIVLYLSPERFTENSRMLFMLQSWQW